MKGRVIISILLISFFCVAIFSTNNIVLADDLSSNISDQLNNLDLNELEDFFNGIYKYLYLKLIIMHLCITY